MTIHSAALLPLLLTALGGAGTLPSGSALHDGSPSDSNIRYIGRWDTGDPATYRGYWSGVYLRAGFTGMTLKVKIANQTELAVSIDSGAPAIVDTGGGVVDLTPKPLKAGSHTVQLGSAGQNYEVEFQGLMLDPGATTLPTPNRPVIEYVGDSITQGNSSYAWRSAEMLDCDHTQIAFSGVALTTGYSLTNPQKIGVDTQYFKLKNFNHLTEADPPLWDFKTYTPQIVVVNLGQNEPREPSVEFVSSYVKFARAVWAKFPAATIVAMRPFSGTHADDVRMAVAQLAPTAGKRIVFVGTEGWLDPKDFRDGTHPNDEGAFKAGFRLAEQLQPLLGK